MNRSSRLALPWVLGAAFAAVAPAQTVDKTPAAKAEVVAKMTQVLEKYAFVPGADFSRLPALLEARKSELEGAKDDDAFARAVNGVLREFGFSHIVLMTPQMGERRATGQQVGIGISSQPVEKGLLIVRVVPDSPAAEGGLKAGDTIVLVDGNKVEGTKGIPGDAGTTVVLRLLRANGKTQDVRLTRRAFSTVIPDTLEWVNPETAKLKVNTFDRAYDPRQIEEFVGQAKGAKNLILDLRSNGGGAVTNLRHLAGLLMPSDRPLGFSVNRTNYNAFLKRGGPAAPALDQVARADGAKLFPQKNPRVEPFAGNIVVLVNGGSGSASEILAAALAEQRQAVTIGQKSAGAVLVSIIVPATNGFFLQYPLSDFVTPEYRRLEGAGVVPDVEIAEMTPFLLPGQKDPTTEKALAVFERARLRAERGLSSRP